MINIKKSIMLSMLLLGNYIVAMEEREIAQQAPIKKLPVELLKLISEKVIYVSPNLEETIKNFKSFAQVILLTMHINLMEKKEDALSLTDFLAAKFTIAPLVVSKKMRLNFSDSENRKLIERAIYRILDKNEITLDEVKAWYEGNKDQVDNVFINYIESLDKIDQKEMLISMSAVLVYANVDPNIQHVSGTTALMIAIENGHKNIIELLLNANVDLKIRGQHNNTALIIACIFGCKDIIELLLTADANPNTKNVCDETALMETIKNGHEGIIVKLLLNAKANPDIQNTCKNTALIMAVAKGSKDVVELLLKFKADPNIQDENGWTALMLAANNDRQDIAELLLKCKADPDAQQVIGFENGWTALMVGAKNGHTEMVKLLLKFKADPHVQCSNGLNAVTLAKTYGHQDIVRLLLRHIRNKRNKTVVNRTNSSTNHRKDSKNSCISF